MVSNRPNTAGQQHPPPGQRNSIRARIEQVSTPAITALSRMPASLPFIVMMALLLTGAVVGGRIGASLLVLPIAFLGWLLYLTWPHLRLPERLLRLAVLLLVLGIAITQLVPQ